MLRCFLVCSSLAIVGLSWSSGFAQRLDASLSPLTGEAPMVVTLTGWVTGDRSGPDGNGDCYWLHGEVSNGIQFLRLWGVPGTPVVGWFFEVPIEFQEPGTYEVNVHITKNGFPPPLLPQRWTVEVLAPSTPVAHATWGAIKALYASDVIGTLTSRISRRLVGDREYKE